MSVIRPPSASRQLTRRFFARFHRSTAAEFIPDNQLTLLSDGAAFFADFFAALAAARQTICLEFYIVRDDATGRQLAELLRQAVARGVRVWFLYDYLGCFDTPAGYFRTLQEQGVACAAFNPPPFQRGLGWFDRRDHRKLAVIDGCVAYAGGVNIGDEYANNGHHPLPWRDMGVRLQGPAAAEVQRIFAENWQEASGLAAPQPLSVRPATSGADRVAIVAGGPHQVRSRIRAAFLLSLAGARERVCIETPYFVPGPLFIRALLRAARRGVRVQLILPAHSDVALVQLVNRSSYGTLLRGGIEVYERQGTVLHAKLMAIDASWSVVGSANLDQRSFHRNYEVSVIVASAAFGRQIVALLEEELVGSRRIVLAEHERRSWLVRLLERLAAPLGWFL